MVYSVPMQFLKMHVLGNDFMIVDGVAQNTVLTPALIPQWSDRHRGIGFDQLLYLMRSTQADFRCMIFNSDGSEALQCCNGLRCVVRYLYDKGYCQKNVSLETKSGIYHLEVISENEVSMCFETVKVKQRLVPWRYDDTCFTISSFYTLIAVGNLHAIVRVETAVQEVSLQQYSHALQMQLNIAGGVNIGLLECIDRTHIRLRTLEHGAGETFACGSNACAAVIAGVVNGWLDASVEVILHYGSLHVVCSTDLQKIHLIGPTTPVFSGEFFLNPT